MAPKPIYLVWKCEFYIVSETATWVQLPLEYCSCTEPSIWYDMVIVKWLHLVQALGISCHASSRQFFHRESLNVRAPVFGYIYN